MDETNEADVVLNGVSFSSGMLAKNLDGLHRVFAYVVTCGREVDQWSHREPDDLVRLWFDMIKEMLMQDARDQFVRRLQEIYGIETLSSINPGSGNLDVWPLQQQTQLFELIGSVQEDTGVELTASLLMIPTKTVSGILFPTEKAYVHCSMCDRERCPNRQVPQDPEFLKTLEKNTAERSAHA